MAKVTGLGGVFFKCPDVKALGDWYRDKLGIDMQNWGGAQFSTAEGPPLTVLGLFRQDTDYFAPSSREFMLNFAVDDLDGMIAQLSAKGVDILKRDDSDPNGRFAWILDPAGTRIELWEPKAE